MARAVHVGERFADAGERAADSVERFYARLTSSKFARWYRHKFNPVIEWFKRFPWALLGFGIIGIAHGVRFLGLTGSIERPPQGLEFLTGFLPLQVYGTLWLIAGVMCLVAIQFRILSWVGLGCIVGMTGLWWLFYFSGWLYGVLNGRPSGIYYIAALYFGLWVAVLGQLPREIEDEDDVTQKTEGAS